MSDDALDLNSGDSLIPLSQVPKLPWIPRRRKGRKLHVSTVFRWAQRGVKGVNLRCLQFGGTKVTTEAALRDFFNRLTERQNDLASIRSSVDQPQAEQVEAALDDAGI